MIDTPSEIDLGGLGPTDALLIIHPTRALPRASLASFLRSGGRVAIADDEGESASFLSLYGVERARYGPGPEALLLRGNPGLPLATPHVEHPLTEGVRGVVANHPATLHHADLDPVLLFEPGSALVLAGAVDEGRLIVIGDSSLFINNMLRFRDNRRFVGNLLRYLGERGGRVLVVSPETRFEGRHGAQRDALARLEDWLARAAKADLPPLALRLLTLVLLAILFVFAVSTLPRRSPYSAAELGLEPPRGGGYASRVSFFARRADARVHSALVYKYELEEELTQRLGLPRSPRLKDVLDAAARAGLSTSERDALRQLLVTLDRLRAQVDLPPKPPTVSPTELARMVDTGERLLARLPDVSPRADARP
ncbi:MAG: hypothetical protein KF901_17020 [Myxococcales bacterium]|nr:hypothetical protein [Myxococcales bacterium]